MTYYVCWRNYEIDGVDEGDAGPFCIEEATAILMLYRQEDAACGFTADYWMEPNDSR